MADRGKGKGGEARVEAGADGGQGGTQPLASPAHPQLHLGLYGEPHAGKSHMLATFVLACGVGASMYIACFDRRG